MVGECFLKTTMIMMSMAHNFKGEIK